MCERNETSNWYIWPHCRWCARCLHNKGKRSASSTSKNYDECINSPCQTRHRLKGCILYSFWNFCFKLSCEALKQNNRCKREVPVPFYDILLLGVWLINWKFPSFNVNFVTIRRIMDNHSDDMFMIEPSIAELVSHFANWNHSEEKFKYVYSRIADSCFTVIPLQDHYLSAEISICPHLCHIHLLWVHPAFTFYNTKSCGPQILRPHTMNFRAMV